jgi:rhodanese-related sulfurtransferase
MVTVATRREALKLLGMGIIAVTWIAFQEKHSAPAHFTVPEVDLQQAKALIEAGAIVIDVRGKEAFDYRHLVPAISIPLSVLQDGIPAILAEAKERQIVVYCNDGHFTGPEATNVLQKNGFKNVVNLKPGVEGWAKAGLPLVKKS